MVYLLPFVSDPELNTAKGVGTPQPSGMHEDGTTNEFKSNEAYTYINVGNMNHVIVEL